MNRKDMNPLPFSGQQVMDGEVTSYSVEESALGELAELRQMLVENPDNTEVLEWLAFRYYTLKRFRESIDVYLDLIRRKHRAGVQYFHLGNAYYKMKRYEMARDAWTKTIELLPSDPKARKARARIEKAEREMHGIG
jgi:tetratricopeptide (TPR) repeat protein